jgi:hypothetical protein
MVLLRRFAHMCGNVLVMVPGLQIRNLLVIVPVGSLTPLIPYSRYIMNAWDVFIALVWVQVIIFALIVN